jgi:hypothetical protein
MLVSALFKNISLTLKLVSCCLYPLKNISTKSNTCKQLVRLRLFVQFKNLPGTNTQAYVNYVCETIKKSFKMGISHWKSVTNFII